MVRPPLTAFPPASIFLAARGTTPTRPPRCLTRPSWGRAEGERRLAGPGLGDATTKRNLAEAVGRSWSCHADPPPTAVGGGRGGLAMQRT